MAYYVGLDVALRSVSACVIDEQGEIVKEAKLDSEVEARLQPRVFRSLMSRGSWVQHSVFTSP